MSVEAWVVHRSPGRMRLRIPSRRGDVAYFTRVREALAGLSGVEQLETNAQTGSVLVIHSGDDSKLVELAQSSDLFEIQVGLPDRPSPLTTIQQRIAGADATLRARSKGDLSLGTVAFYALLGSTGYQIARGNFLPAGATLLFQAFNVLVRGVELERRAASERS